MAVSSRLWLDTGAPAVWDLEAYCQNGVGGSLLSLFWGRRAHSIAAL